MINYVKFAQSQHSFVIPKNYSYESMNLAKRIGIERMSTYSYTRNNSESMTAEGVVRADLEGAVGSFLSWKFWGKTAGGLMFGPTGAVMTASKEIVKGAIVGSGVNVISGLLW